MDLRNLKFENESFDGIWCMAGMVNLPREDLIKSIDNILGNLKIVSKREKSLRAGKGKLRNRKYKKSAGVLIITGDKEEIKTNSFNQIKIKDLIVSDLYPAGRVVVYTEEAIKSFLEMDS